MSRLYRTVEDFFHGVKRDGSFTQNFVITFSGNSLAVIIGFLFTPFIARVYSPEAYGVFGVYIAIAQNISLISTLQLTRAFTQVASVQELNRLFAATIFCTIVGFFILTGTIAIGGQSLVHLFKLESIGWAIYLLPITMLYASVNDSYKSWNVYSKNFKVNASNQVVASLVSRSTTLGYGLIRTEHLPGLIYGDLVSRIVENINLGRKGAGRMFWQALRSLLHFKSHFNIISSFKNYPLFILPSAWVAIFAGQMPLLFISGSFGSEEAGYFSLSNSLLNIPVSVLASAMAPVFLQRASEVHRTEPERLPVIVRMLSVRLFLTGVFPILILTVFGDYIFSIVFGKDWTVAGIFAGYMGFYFLLQVITTPLLSIFRILKKEPLQLYANTALILINMVTLSIGWISEDIQLLVLLYSLGNVLYCVILAGVIFSLVRLSWLRLFAMVILIGGMATGVLFSLRFLIEHFFNG